MGKAGDGAEVYEFDGYDSLKPWALVSLTHVILQGHANREPIGGPGSNL